MNLERFLGDIGPVWHREAALFASPDWASWATPRCAMDVMTGAAREHERRRGAIRWRFFDGGELVSKSDPSLLPPADVGELDAYFSFLQQHTGAPGLIVNQAQAAALSAWSAVAPLVAAITSEFGLPYGGSLLDLFIAGRAESFFGLHKDDQDVFMFVTRGRKRVELWRYETLAEELGSPGYYGSLHQGQVSTTVIPDQVLEAGEGDVLYWPAGYWHRVINLEPVTAGFSLGLFTRPDALALLARLESMNVPGRPRSCDGPQVRRGLTPGRRPDEEIRELVQALTECPREMGHLSAAVAAWRSALGFAVSPELQRPESVGDRRFATIAKSLLEVHHEAGHLLLCAGGKAVRYPADLGLRSALEHLARGHETSLDELLVVAEQSDESWGDFATGEARRVLDRVCCDLAAACVIRPTGASSSSKNNTTHQRR